MACKVLLADRQPFGRKSRLRRYVTDRLQPSLIGHLRCLVLQGLFDAHPVIRERLVPKDVGVESSLVEVWWSRQHPRSRLSYKLVVEARQARAMGQHVLGPLVGHQEVRKIHRYRRFEVLESKRHLVRAHQLAQRHTLLERLKQNRVAVAGLVRSKSKQRKLKKLSTRVVQHRNPLVGLNLPLSEPVALQQAQPGPLLQHPRKWFRFQVAPPVRDQNKVGAVGVPL